MKRVLGIAVRCAVLFATGCFINLAVSAVLATRTEHATFRNGQGWASNDYLWHDRNGKIWEVTEYQAFGVVQHHVGTGMLTALWDMPLRDGLSPFLDRPRPPEWEVPAWSGYLRHDLENMNGFMSAGPDFTALPSEARYGWPMLAFAARAKPDPITWQPNDQLRLAVPGLTREVVVPWYPLWQGIAVNTVFYATVVFVAMRLLQQIARFSRALRGLCVRCGYNLAGLDACPECGNDPL